MINSVCLIGRLTYEPELRSTPSGVSVIRFQIACDRTYQKQGEERKADFIDCVAWRQTAEFVSRYFHKGSMIAIEGSIQTDNYTDKNGNQRKSVEVVANNVSFCESKKNATEDVTEPNLGIPVEETQYEEEIIDDLPF
jgi:single-strand DNA-binding protein